MTKPLLVLDDLHVRFHTDDGEVNAVRGVSFTVSPGETLGIVGESGSGKTVTNLAMMGLLPTPPAEVFRGTALFKGEDLLKLDTKQLVKVRGKEISMIFQDPMTSLNPFLTVERQLTEVTMLHLGHSREEARTHAIEMLERVGIPAASSRIDNYPHQFSGGMRQRVMIAMALACKPKLLIADEPTTALDVTIQAQILDLIKQLQQEEGTAVILITHDLGVVANICQNVLVMYAGKIVEQASAASLFAAPRHPYTLGLLESIPRWDEEKSDLLQAIEGQPPDLVNPPSGCTFHPRCRFRLPECDKVFPPLEPRPHGGKFACYADVSKEG